MNHLCYLKEGKGEMIIRRRKLLLGIRLKIDDKCPKKML
jgi:hypothetical protein